MDWTQILIAAIGGGGFIKLLEFFTKRKERRVVTEQGIVELVVNKIGEQRDLYKKQVEELERKYDLLELEVQGLRLVNGRDPFPRWLVDMQGRYIFINPCFEERFLKPLNKMARDLIGQTHETGGLWPLDFCAKLRTLDEIARQRPDGRAKAVMRVHGQMLTVYKLPVRHVPSGAIMAYEGWITDIEIEEDLV